MTSRPQQRDSQGRFTRSVQPQPIEEQPQQTPQPQASTSHFDRVQHTFIAISTPILSSIPVSQVVSTVVSALQFSTPNSDTPTAPQPKSESIPPSPTCYVPPPCYATEPPLAPPDFNAPRSDNSPPRASLPSQLEGTFIDTVQQPAPDSDNDKQLFPPLPQRPQTPPQPARHCPRSRPLPPLLPLPPHA